MKIHKTFQKLKKQQNHFYPKLTVKRYKIKLILRVTTLDLKAQPELRIKTGYQIQIIGREIIK